eukprot:05374_1
MALLPQCKVAHLLGAGRTRWSASVQAASLLRHCGYALELPCRRKLPRGKGLLRLVHRKDKERCALPHHYRASAPYAPFHTRRISRNRPPCHDHRRE